MRDEKPVFYFRNTVQPLSCVAAASCSDRFAALLQPGLPPLLTQQRAGTKH